MPIQKKLNFEQEREITLSYLCGVDVNQFKEKYGLSNSHIISNIVGKCSREWNDPLIEFYRQNSFNKDLNSVHMFLSFQKGIEQPEPIGLINPERDNPAYSTVKAEIYTPEINKILDRTSLEEYVTRYIEDNNPYGILIGRIFGVEHTHRIVHNELLNALQDAYKSKEKFLLYEIVHKELLDTFPDTHKPKEKLSLDNIFDQVGNTIIDKIREGGLVWTDMKKDFFNKTLGKLEDREKAIIGMRWGLYGYERPRTLNDIGQNLMISRERARQIEMSALKKLESSSKFNELIICANLSTDADIKAYVEQKQYQQEREKWRKELYPEIRNEILDTHGIESPNQTLENIKSRNIDELDLSSRAENCLRRFNIQTIGELASCTETELLRLRNFGRISLNEIKGVLGSLNMNLRKS